MNVINAQTTPGLPACPGNGSQQVVRGHQVRRENQINAVDAGLGNGDHPTGEYDGQIAREMDAQQSPVHWRTTGIPPAKRPGGGHRTARIAAHPAPPRQW